MEWAFLKKDVLKTPTRNGLNKTDMDINVSTIQQDQSYRKAVS